MTDTEIGTDWAAVHRQLAAGEKSLASLTEVSGERFKALLGERARALAISESAVPRAATVQVLVVRAGAEQYGLEMAGLAGIQWFGPCAPVPWGPDELLGLVNAQGEIWAAFEFRRLLGSGTDDAPSGGKLVLLRHNRRRVGLRVDETERVREIVRADLKTPPDTASAIPSKFIKGMTSDSIIIVDLAALWIHPAIAEEA